MKNKYQSLTPGQPDPWQPYLLMDGWRQALACKLLVFGFELDLEWVAEDYRKMDFETSGFKEAQARLDNYQRVWRLADSAILAGALREGSSPQEWIAWASLKGYSVEHLDPSVQIQIFEQLIVRTEMHQKDSGQSFRNVIESYRSQLQAWIELSTMISRDSTTRKALSRTRPKQEQYADMIRAALNDAGHAEPIPNAYGAGKSGLKRKIKEQLVPLMMTDSNFDSGWKLIAKK